MGHTAEMTRAGMLLSYAPNYPLMFQRIAFYIDKILRGEKPAEMPVEQPTKFELVINLKTAVTVRHWPKADIASCTAHVCFWG
jgi:putative ABC transport system substrate-binding protein